MNVPRMNCQWLPATKADLANATQIILDAIEANNNAQLAALTARLKATTAQLDAAVKANLVIQKPQGSGQGPAAPR